MQITKFRSELFIALEQLTVHLQQARNTLTRLGKSIADQPRRLQEALRERENGLRKLLASSLDAIVVTNSDRRFVAANPKALDLFGISETNMKKFTIDAFLSDGPILDFEGNGPPFIKREERHGKCKISRLDGSLRVAEYIFVANFVPLRHVSRFRDVTPEKAQGKSIEKVSPGHGDLSARIAELNLDTVRIREQPRTTMPGIVDRIIPFPHPSQPKKAQIAVEGTGHRYRNLRIDNTLTDEHGADVSLKKGAHVEVTVTAKPKFVNPPQLTKREEA